MINNISWSSYWSALSVLLFFYYAYVLLRYYRRDIHSRLAGSPSIQIDKGLKNEALLPEVQGLTDEISAYLEQAAHAGIVKQEIVFALQQIALKYMSVRNSQYQPAVESLIQIECGNKCAIHLSVEEVRQVWMG